MSDDSSNLSKPRYLCEPWDGTQGAAFTRHFAPEFKGALHGIQDKLATLFDHLNEDDPGSINNPHLGALNSEPRLESERLYRLRSRKLFSLVRQHVLDETVRQDIDDNANHNGVDAWKIVERYGQQPRTGLTEIDEDAAWTSLRLSDVGIDEKTIINIVAHMNRLNREREAARQYNNEAKRKKLLSLLTFPAHLAAKAQEELQRPSYKENNQPSLNLTVKAFDELWRHAFRNGLIKRQAPPQKSRGGNRVDAMLVGTNEQDDYAYDPDLEKGGIAPDADEEVFGAFTKFNGVPTSLKGQKLCNNCMGWGHDEQACPSDKRPRRAGDCIDGVRYLKLSRGRPFDRRDGPNKSLPNHLRTKKGRFNKRFKFHDKQTNRTYVVEADEQGDLRALDSSIDVNDAPEADTLDSHALVDDDNGIDAFGVIPTIADGHMAWFSDDDAHGAEAETNTMDATRDPDVASYLRNAHSPRDDASLNKHDPRSRSAGSSLSLAIATHVLSLPRKLLAMITLAAMRRAQRTVVALLVLMLALVDSSPITSPPLHATYTAYAADTPTVNAVLIDSGSTRTASGNRRLFPSGKIKQTRPNMRVRVANGVYLPVEFVGTLVLDLPPGEVKTSSGVLSSAPTRLELHNALYVPGLCATLLSTKAIFREQGIRTYLNDELRLVLPDARHVRIRETATNYSLRTCACDDTAFAVNAEKPRGKQGERAGGHDTDLIHARLAHFSIDRINMTVGHAHGLDTRFPASAKPCRSCQLAGATKPPTKRPTQRTYDHYGECIASDLCEMPASSPFGFRYMLTFYDLATKFLEVYYLRTATGKEVKASFEQFLAENKRYIGNRGVTWLTDNGAEFFERNLDKFLREFEIRHRATVPYNPQTNPAERANRLLLRPCRILLAAANAEAWMWPWAINQITYIHNALCTRSATAIAPLTPYELKTGSQPRVDKLRVMFCEVACYLRGEAQEMSKLAPRRVKGIHLGIDQRRGGYFVYLPDINRLTTIRFDDTVFDEESFPEVQRITGTYVSYTTRYALPSVEQQIDNSQADPPQSLSPHRDDEAEATNDTPDDGGPAHNDDGPPSSRLRSRTRFSGHACTAEEAPEDHLALAVIDDSNLVLYLNKAALISDVMPEPRSVGELAGRPDEEEWRQAILEEYKGKLANDTFELVRRPAGRTVCKTKLVFKNKLENGTLKKRKVRWVLCGYSQKPGIDYSRTFTATARATSVRIFFAFVAYHDLNLRGIDVTRAFTHAELTDAELYCEQMEGMELRDKETGEKLVCKLKKALEGGKQCGHLWQTKLTSFLKGVGFKQFYAEPCIFTMKDEHGLLVLLVWIDDVVIAYDVEAAADRFTEEFKREFKSTVNNDVRRFIGMEIKRDRAARTITISQREYVEKMANRFLPAPSLRKTVSTPAWFTDKAGRVSTYSNLGTAKDENDSAVGRGKPYLELVASILYAEIMTRPDIAYHIGMLCRFMHNPSLDCFARAEELLNYLYATRDQCIVLGGQTIDVPIFTTLRDAGAKELSADELKARLTGNAGLMTYSDSSWKVDHTYVAHVSFVMNGPVDWSARLLKVSASSCHAETAAACMAAKRNRYIRALLSHLFNLVSTELKGGATMLFMDNSAAVDQAENLSASKKTEHYRRWEYTLREAQTDGEIKAVFVRTTEQVADILTKVVDKTTYLKHVRSLLKGKV